MKVQPPATYEQMGILALLPGMRRMLELMQREVDELEARLLGLQAPLRKKAGRPRKGTAARATLPSGWPADPEERKREMRRRMAKRRRNAEAVPVVKLTTDARKTEAFRKKMRRAAKKRWDNMPAGERAANLAAMQAGRKAVA